MKTKQWALVALILLGGAGRGAAQETIQIDAAGAARPFPHFWEQVFGSGRANLSLRESYRKDLRSTREITEFKYVRFHAIFQDENGVYSVDAKGNPVYNWSYVDQIYDGLLENHVRPFIELSFMPKALAASQTPHAFWYKQLPNPPTDYAKWGALIENFTRHLVERYGLDEVAQWYFEVWNEPNIDFWTGDPKEETYYRLYRSAADAIKKVSPRLIVGGPATAQAAWVGKMIAWAVREKAPLDFVSTHVYANDKAEDVFGTHEKISRHDMVARSVKKVHDEVKKSAMPNIPIHWSEYNASYMNEVDVTDSSFMGPWLANNIRACDGMTTTMSYWTFSDVFEEQGIVKTPFYGGFGLIAAGGIPKASFNVFKLLHQLGDQRLPVNSESALATKRADGTLAIAVWNYSEPYDKGSPREFSLQFKGMSGGRHARVTIVDKDHGSSLEAWKAMGSPAHPTRDQASQLKKAAGLVAVEKRPLRNGVLTLKLQDKALALVEVEK